MNLGNFGKSHKSRGIFMDIMCKRIFELVGNKHGAIKELAAAINVSGNLISDWKAGRAKSYPRYAPQIAAYYGVSLDWLSGATDDRAQKIAPSPEEDEASKLRQKVADKLNDMSEDQLERLLAVIDLIYRP